MIRQGGRRGKDWGSLVRDAHSAPSLQPVREAAVATRLFAQLLPGLLLPPFPPPHPKSSEWVSTVAAGRARPPLGRRAPGESEV